MPRSLLLGAVLLLTSACHASLPVVAPTAQRAPPPPVVTTPSRTFQDAAEALTTRCDPGPIDGSTMEMTEKMHARLECLRGEVNAVLGESGEAEPLLFAAYVNDACLLQEDIQWTDPVTGAESHGTLRSFEDMACQENLLVERYFLVVAKRVGASDAVADHLRAVWPRGDIARRHLVVLRSTRALGARGDVAERTARQLSEATCSAWPDLETTLGGRSACAAEIERWYVGSVAGEKGFASEWR